MPFGHEIGKVGNTDDKDTVVWSLFQNFNAWMGIGEEMLQQEIPRDTTYQDMDTTASCCIDVFSTLPSFQLFCVSENKGDNN